MKLVKVEETTTTKYGKEVSHQEKRTYAQEQDQGPIWFRIIVILAPWIALVIALILGLA